MFPLIEFQQRSPAFHFSAPHFSAKISFNAGFLAEKWDQYQIECLTALPLEHQSRFFVCKVLPFRTLGFEFAAQHFESWIIS
jgi:hypothetical protein